MAESPRSMFESDPTSITPSQRVAQAHAAHNGTEPGPGSLALLDSDSESASDAHEVPTPKVANGSSREVNFADKSLFPTLGGGSKALSSKSLWGNSRISSIVPASQGPAADLMTETVKLEASQQQPRSLGKNNAGDVVKKLQKDTSTSIQMSTAQKTGTTTFLIRGKPEAVALARRTLLKELGKKVLLKLLVPSAVRPYIIGSKGRTLKAIIEKTGARVQLPKRDDALPNDSEVDPEEMVELTIEGDFDGANLARQEIEQIVSERTSSISVKITSIPSDFYALLGRETAKLEEGRDLKIKIPSISFSEDVPSAINVSGDKTLVAEIKEQLEALYNHLKLSTIPTTIPVPRKQHRFIVSSLTDILDSTGCSVIVPPASSASDLITIRGPASSIGAAITQVMDKANSMTVDYLEISRAHPSAPNQVDHAADITKYFLKTNELENLKKKHSVEIIVPSRKEILQSNKVVYEFSGNVASNVAQARKDMIALVNSLPPAKVSRFEVEPLLHKRVMGSKSKNLVSFRMQHQVELCFPFGDDGDVFVVLVHGSSASSDETAASMQAAKHALAQIVAEAGDIASATIQIDAKQHSKIMGKNNTTLNAITGGSESLVRVLFGEPEADSITVKGPKSDVVRVIADIQCVIEEAKNAETANAYKIEFQFPAQFTKNLIGKSGANISRIREELGVRIDVGDEGKITVQGPQRNAEEAKSRITLLGERLADETTLRLKVPAEFHGQLIGQGGKIVKRLEEKYQVQITFPRSGGDLAEDEDRPAKNEITVKGGKKGAAAAKSEIMEFFEFENEHSYSVTIEVLLRAVPQIVGKSGTTINELKDETNTRIDIDRANGAEEKDPNAKVSITITGKKVQVEKATSAIESINKEIANTEMRTITVDPAHHRTLIGSGGATIRDIVTKAGGPEDASSRARMVRFPKAGGDSKEIVLKGPKEVIDKIVKAIAKLVGDFDSQDSRSINVAKEQVRMIIGRGGSKKAELESKYKVTIDIPRAESVEGTEMPVKILGSADSVEQAVVEITKLVKVPESETVQVPRSVHRAVADSGAFIRRLKNDYKISIDHDGHELPKPLPKLSNSVPSKTARIDDDETTADYPWTISENTSSSETGDIPWVLKGESGQIVKAKKALAKAVEQAQSQTHTGYLVVPSSKHRFIVGPGGSKINSIRESSGVKIDVPKNQDDDTVVLKGSLEGLEKARTLIVEATTSPSGKRSYD